MKTNRIIVFTLLLMLPLASVLANGGSDSAETASKEMVNISWHQIGNPQEELPVVMEEVNKYLGDKFGINLDITVHGWGDYTTKMQTMHAAGESFDLAFTSGWANPFIPTASKGAYLPLDNLLKDYGKDILSILPAKYWDAAKIDGKIMAIINYQIMSNQRGIAFVKEYADKYGFDPDKVTQNKQIFDFFQQIVDNEEGVVPYFNLKEGILPDLNPQEETRYFDDIISEEDRYIGVYLTDTTPTVVNTLISPEYRRDVESVREMLSAGYIPSDFTSLNLDEEVKGREYASFIMTRIKPGVEGENLVRYGKDTIVSGLYKPYTSTGSASSTMTAIGVNSQHPEKAMELYNAVYSDKYLYNLLVFGVKDVHYTDAGNGYVNLDTDKSYGLPAWQFGDQFNAYLMPGQDPDVWQQTMDLDASAVVSPLLGFVFDPSPVRNEIAACGAINAEYKISVYYADNLDEAMADFNKAMEEAGIDRIITEAQKQIDAWLATK